MKIQILFLISIQSLSCMIVKQQTTTSNERILEGGLTDLLTTQTATAAVASIGASALLLNYISSNTAKKKSVEEEPFTPQYNEMYFTLVNTNKRHKELELLTYYANTYRKDLTNKCKIAVKLYLSTSGIGEESEIKEFFKLCKRFGNFAFDNLHLSQSFYKINHAFYYFVQSVEKELMWERVSTNKMRKAQMEDEIIDEKAKDELKRRERLKLLTAILDQAIQNSGKTMEEMERQYSVDFSLINQFYNGYFYPLFKDVLNTNKLQRNVKEIREDDNVNLDLLYGIDEEVKKAEDERISYDENVAVVDNFDDCGVMSLYRFYQVGWMEPLINIKEAFPVMID